MLVSQFEFIAKKQGFSCAIIDNGARMTYEQLDESSSKIAHLIANQEDVKFLNVGLLINRGFGFVQAVLGVLKAGGIYVPIDPSLPMSRAQFIAEDSCVELLLVERSLAKCQLVDSLLKSGIKILILEEILENFVGECTFNRKKSSLESTACIIYTSGTTGTPKGILVPQRGILQLVVNQSHIPVSPGDCFGHGTNCSFDASILEIFGALLNGATLVILSSETMRSAALLQDGINRHSINLMFLTPALFYEYVLEGVDFSSLDFLILGGEALNPKIIALAFNRRLVRRGCLVNGYGPAEATACTTSFAINELNVCWRGIPIGKPMDGVEIYILDEEGRPVEDGLVGELYIGGAGVANGYWNRPELTKERFLPNVFSPNKSGTLYRTGDFVRKLPCGNLDFVGRKDNQVKIRGFRIELDGIEHCLNQLPKIGSSCVNLHVCDAGHKQLIAHVVPSQTPFYTLQELREELIKLVPEYMIPHQFFLLESMPVNQNGKIDRNVLKGLPGKLIRCANSHIDPESQQESILHEIWKEIFGRNDIGITDNFFELGGDSINAIEMIDKANKMGMKLEIPHLFFAPTIRQLALCSINN